MKKHFVWSLFTFLIGMTASGLRQLFISPTTEAENHREARSLTAGKEDPIVAEYRKKANITQQTWQELKDSILANETSEGKLSQAKAAIGELFRYNPAKAISFSKFIRKQIDPNTSESDLSNLDFIAKIELEYDGGKLSPLVGKFQLSALSDPNRIKDTPTNIDRGRVGEALRKSFLEDSGNYSQSVAAMLESGAIKTADLPAMGNLRMAEKLAPLAMDMIKKDPQVINEAFWGAAAFTLNAQEAHKMLLNLPDSSVNGEYGSRWVTVMAKRIADFDSAAAAELLVRSHSEKMHKAIFKGMMQAEIGEELINSASWTSLNSQEQLQVQINSLRKTWLSDGTEAVSGQISELLTSETMIPKETLSALENFYIKDISDPASGFKFGMQLRNMGARDQFLAKIAESWAAEDVVGASLALVEYPPEQVPDSVTLALINEIPQDDLDARLAWASRINDPALQKQYTDSLISQLQSKEQSDKTVEK